MTIAAPNGTQPIWSFAETLPEGTAEVAIAYGDEMPSHLLLPVVPGVEAPTDLPPCPGLRGQPCRDYQAFTNRLADPQSPTDGEERPRPAAGRRQLKAARLALKASRQAVRRSPASARRSAASASGTKARTVAKSARVPAIASTNGGSRSGETELAGRLSNPGFFGSR